MLVGSVRLLHVGTQPRVGSVRFEHGNTEAGKCEVCTCGKTVSGECEVCTCGNMVGGSVRFVHVGTR